MPANVGEGVTSSGQGWDFEANATRLHLLENINPWYPKTHLAIPKHFGPPKQRLGLLNKLVASPQKDRKRCHS